MEAKRSKAYQLIASARVSDQFPWWEWNIPDNTVTASPLKVTMLGYAESEFAGVGYQAYTDLLHPDDYERTMEAMRAHLEGRAPLYEIDYRIRTRSGEYVWYMDRGVIIERSQDGTPLVLRGIVINLGSELSRLAHDDALVRAVRRRLPDGAAARSHPVICAQCGRLRYSQSRWIAVDESFSAGFEGEISHTLCPDCVRLLYPRVAPTVISRLGYAERDAVSVVLLEPRRIIRDLLMVALEGDESLELVSTPSSVDALDDVLQRDRVDVVVLSIDWLWPAPVDLVRSIRRRFSAVGVACYGVVLVAPVGSD
ncbi:MAG: PAS domain-containing protein, partial [Spirochaetota bacterium]